MQIWEQKGTRLFFFSFFKPAAAYRGCQRGGGSTQVVGTGPCVPPPSAPAPKDDFGSCRPSGAAELSWEGIASAWVN